MKDSFPHGSTWLPCTSTSSPKATSAGSSPPNTRCPSTPASLKPSPWAASSWPWTGSCSSASTATTPGTRRSSTCTRAGTSWNRSAGSWLPVRQHRPCLSSTTSTSDRSGATPGGCTTAPASSAPRSWPAPPFPSVGATPGWSTSRRPPYRKPSPSASPASTSTAPTPSKACSAWSNAGRGARPAWPRSPAWKAMPFGKPPTRESGRATWPKPPAPAFRTNPKGAWRTTARIPPSSWWSTATA